MADDGTPQPDTLFRPAFLTLAAVVCGYSVSGVFLAISGHCGGGGALVTMLVYTMAWSLQYWLLPPIVVPLALWVFFFSGQREFRASIPGTIVLTGIVFGAYVVCSVLFAGTSGCPKMQL